MSYYPRRCNPCRPLVSPCAPPCPSPCIGPCGAVSQYVSPCDPCNPCGPCDCRKCRDRYDYSDRHSYRSDRSDYGERRKSRRRCGKCYQYNCSCAEFFPFLRVDCGCISATLSKTASPTSFTAAGQVITYTYVVVNTGTAPICYPIQICDNRLGNQIFPVTYIPPGGSAVFTRTYTITTADLLLPSITNTATAAIQVRCDQFVSTPPATATVTFGSADLFGSIAQVAGAAGTVGGVGATGVQVTVSVINSGASVSAALNASLILPFPVGVSAVTAVAGPVTVNGANVTISIPSLSPGVTSTSVFNYTAPLGGSYTWAGTITSSTYDPSLLNNFVSNTITV